MSIGGTFVPQHSRSLELLSPGTFVLKGKSNIELSFPGAKVVELSLSVVKKNAASVNIMKICA